jgi:adenylate cyclase
MPRIKVEPTGEEFEASSAVSLLNNLQRQGLRISHVCGGKAVCGTCRVRILRGEEGLSRIGQAEEVRLKALGNPAHTRLACQTYAFADVTLSIVVKKG